MAASAVSCSLMSRGCLNVRVVSAQSAVVRNSSSGINQLAWDPLRQAMLCSSKSTYLSSFSPSIALGRKFSEPQRSSRLRMAVPRASTKEDEESEQVSKIESEPNVGKSLESAKKVWPQFLTSAAKPAVVAMMVALLLAQPVEEAFAASTGGRVGGKAFSKPSAPPSRSYSGGGGGGRAYSGGGGGVYVAPPLYGSPYGLSPFGYSPFYGGGYGGGGFLGPVGFGGGGTIILAMIAFATLRGVVGFIRDRFSGDEDRFDD